MQFDISQFPDGAVTVSVTLTNGAGNSTATNTTITKDTVPPALSVSTPPYINNSNVMSFPITVLGEQGASASYSITDGTTTINSSRTAIPASGKWNASSNLSKLNNGPVTLTVTETDPAGNPTVSTTKLTKMVQTVAAPTVALNPISDSGVSNSDYITNINTPQFTTTTASGTTAAVYVNGVAYTGQKLADGSYTVTAIATDQFGNTSTAGTAAKTLVIVTSPPSGSWTVSGGKVISGQLSTNNTTPTLALTFSDPGGIATAAVSTNGGTSYAASVPYASTVTTSLSGGDGLYTIVVKLTDVAGNVGTYSQTVRLDTTGPTISASLSAPQSTIGYDGTADITISASATDQSGVSSLKIVLDSTTTITNGTVDLDTLLAGTHTIVVTAVDGLGNTSTQTLTFALHPSRKGIGNAVNEGVKSGSITSSEASTLLSMLNNTANSLATDLNNFLAEVKRQSGKAITSAEATILTSWANDDLTTLY
jgi:hypothetical protein